jgi:hypothetical protein
VLTIWTSGLAILPRLRAPITERRLTPRANHVQTTLIPFNQVITPRTRLPVLLLCQIFRSLRLFIFCTKGPWMCLLPAMPTCLCIALLACPNISNNNPRRQEFPTFHTAAEHRVRRRPECPISQSQISAD